MPKLPPADFVWDRDTVHPVTGVDIGPYAHRILGDVAGLTQFGAHLECLPPGSRSALRHWHETEDELVHVLEGEVWLIEETETLLRAGDTAAWPAGHPVGHCLENRGPGDALYLTVGTRHVDDVVHYPDDGLTLHKTGRRRRFVRADGSVAADYEK